MTPYETTIHELSTAGIRFRESSNGKHIKIRFRVKGRKCMVVCSKSTSDKRACLNARLLVRRIIRNAIKD